MRRKVQGRSASVWRRWMHRVHAGRHPTFSVSKGCPTMTRAMPAAVPLAKFAPAVGDAAALCAPSCSSARALLSSMRSWRLGVAREAPCSSVRLSLWWCSPSPPHPAPADWPLAVSFLGTAKAAAAMQRSACRRVSWAPSAPARMCLLGGGLWACRSALQRPRRRAGGALACTRGPSVTN